MSEKLVIIGGVAAGMKTAAKARRENPDLEIVVFQEEEEISYAGCGLTYYISDVIKNRSELVHRTPEIMKEKSNINVLVRHYVKAIRPENKEITVLNLETNEEFNVKYDKLVIATGASARKLNVEGENSNNVFCLKSIYDADQIKLAVQKAKKVVVAGGGFLGVEAIEAMRELDLDVSMIVTSEHMLRDFDKDIAYHVARHCQQKGVKIYTSESILKLEADENNNVKKVITSNRELEADLVLVCKGVKPNVEIVKNAGIKIGVSGGIEVNEHLETQVKDIYAGGDCAESIYLINNEKMCYSSGSIANKHGRIIGENVCGNDLKFEGALKSRIMKIFDMTVARVGMSEREARKGGYNVEAAVVPGDDHAHYYPGAQKIVLKMIADKETHKILGIQSFGLGEVAKRIDVAAVSLTAGMTTDQVAQADLTYAPPYSPAMDVLIVAANVLTNKMNGHAEGILPEEFLEKMKTDPEGYILVDVRPPEEFVTGKIKGAISIPYGMLGKKMSELDKNKEIITQCKIGKMSYLAYRKLKNNGFTNVRYLDGGVIAWVDDLEPVK